MARLRRINSDLEAIIRATVRAESRPKITEILEKEAMGNLGTTQERTHHEKMMELFEKRLRATYQNLKKLRDEMEKNKGENNK